jgi:hypothetical protein
MAETRTISGMSESSEVAALKAAFVGVAESFERLQGLRPRVDSLEPANPPPADLLMDLGRLAGAHATAAQALRGLLGQLAGPGQPAPSQPPHG